MPNDWKIPKWMKKYLKYLLKTESDNIEELMNDRQIVVMHNPHNFINCAKMKVQIKLLERLYNEGIIE